MKAMAWDDFRSNPSGAFDKVIDDAEELVVTRAGKENVVIVAKRDWDTIQETLYLSRDKTLMEQIANDREQAQDYAIIRVSLSIAEQLETLRLALGLDSIDEVVKVVIAEWRDRITTLVDRQSDQST